MINNSQNQNAAKTSRSVEFTFHKYDLSDKRYKQKKCRNANMCFLWFYSLATWANQFLSLNSGSML